MTSRVHQQRRRPGVIFHRLTSRTRDADKDKASKTSRPRDRSARDADMAASSADMEQPPSFDIPSLFTTDPPLRDSLRTDTSLLQDGTVAEVLPFITGVDGDTPDERNDRGIPHVDRHRHATFLRRQLGHLPQMFTPADPSRPWFFYWCLSGLALLGEDVTAYRNRLAATVGPMQNASTSGGFAGGFGQTSHLATTYATVLSLAMVGGVEAFQLVDRRSMWKWLCSLKQPGGGFQMAVGGEEDVRYVNQQHPPPLLLRWQARVEHLAKVSVRTEAHTALPSSSPSSDSPSTCPPTRPHTLQATPTSSVAWPTGYANVSHQTSWTPSDTHLLQHLCLSLLNRPDVRRRSVGQTWHRGPRSLRLLRPWLSLHHRFSASFRP